MTTPLEDLKFQVNCAALEAIDSKLAELLPQHERKTWIKDSMLPKLLPAIEEATEKALREVYDLYPESLDVEPEVAERSRRQLAESLERLNKLKDMDESKWSEGYGVLIANGEECSPRQTVRYAFRITAPNEMQMYFDRSLAWEPSVEGDITFELRTNDHTLLFSSINRMTKGMVYTLQSEHRQ